MTDQGNQPAPARGPWHSIQVYFHKHAGPGQGREQYATGHLNATDALTAINQWVDDNGIDPAAVVDPLTGLPPGAGDEPPPAAAPAGQDELPGVAAEAASGLPGAVQGVPGPVVPSDDQPG